jgi:hypothetical protein
MNSKTSRRFLSLFASALLLLATTASAQMNYTSSSLLIMEKTEVSASVIKSFEQKFKNATPVNWYQAKENNVLVKYNQNAQTQYVLFSTNGTVLSQFTYGTEKNLPVRIKNLFREKYWNVTVVNVANVKQDSRDFWIVYAQQGENPFSVKIEDGEVKEL